MNRLFDEGDSHRAQLSQLRLSISVARHRNGNQHAIEEEAKRDSKMLIDLPRHHNEHEWYEVRRPPAAQDRCVEQVWLEQVARYGRRFWFVERGELVVHANRISQIPQRNARIEHLLVWQWTQFTHDDSLIRPTVAEPMADVCKARACTSESSDHRENVRHPALHVRRCLSADESGRPTLAEL